tara:strand:+ start:1150 stop:1461 length:312 start_codon:yes stop_codon:yes gene_type:complete
MSQIEVTKDGITNTIVASLEFAKTAFPAKNGYSYKDVSPEAPELTQEEERAKEERRWRDDELKNSDWVVQVPDHPQKTDYTTYRAALRDWPSTADFPDTKPTL